MRAGTEAERESFYAELVYAACADDALGAWADVLEYHWDATGAPQGGADARVRLLVGDEEVEVSNRTIAAGFKVLNRLMQARRDADTEAVTLQDLDLLVQLGLYGRVKYT